MEINETEPEIKIEYEDTNADDPLFVNKKYKKDVSCEKLNSKVLEDSQNSQLNKTNETWFKFIDDSGKYHCRFCEHTYSTLQTIRVHTKRKHQLQVANIKTAIYSNKRERKKKLKCHSCKEIFSTLKELECHFQGTHKVVKENYCHICQSVFENENMLSDHLSSKHGILLSKLLVCDTCGYTTPKLSHFKQHKNIHLSLKTLKCQYCDYETYNLSNLNIHKEIHNKEKPYLCDSNGCDYKTNSRASLKSHQLKHNKENNFKYCDRCPFKTVYMQTLQKHLDSHIRNSIKIKSSTVER